MNYGYAFTDPRDSIDLRPYDEADRYCAQLYHVVAAQADLNGLRIVDIGSGRGGGASFVHRYHGPRQTIGIDVANSAVRFCQRVYKNVDGLEFRQGDAMALPFDDGSVDAILNVESSHCYPDKAKFFAEVRRVLRPGGHFLYTDFTEVDQAMDQHLATAGFERLEERDITQNIVRGLEIDNARRLNFIRDKVPFGFRRLVKLWAAAPGSWFFADLKTGRRKYLLYHAVKGE